MPALDVYRRMLGVGGVRTNGNAHKVQSDMVINATWWNDIDARVGYFYDFYHDPDPHGLRGLDPVKDKKIPIDIKYVKHTSQTLDKDAVSYHLQFRPGQECPVDYYADYVRRYDLEWPCGLYVDIENESGRWDRWLVVSKADAEATQFPTWEILKCDYTFQYIIAGKKYEVAGVSRSQNSYNSGLWTDYRITSIEDQAKFIVPLNEDTEKIYYTDNDANNLRFIIDTKVKTEPRAFKVSKVNRLTSNGVVRVTLAQDLYDPHKDYIELDDDGIVIGMWADYYANGKAVPTAAIAEPNSTIYSEITWSGVKPEIKVDGGYKKFSVTFYNDKEPIALHDGQWAFDIDGEDATAFVETKVFGDSSDIQENQIKVKFIGDRSYIGRVLHVTYQSLDGITSTADINIAGM